MNKLLSIITINFNNSEGLSKTIKSVINQEEKAFEYIVIDGGSTDASVEILTKNNDSIDYWLSEKDLGIYHAMNKGIVQASGDYLMFLNSGDILADKFIISKCFLAMNKDCTVDIWYGDAKIENSCNPALNILQHPIALSLRYFKNSTINHQASFIKRKIFTQFGLYPENYKLASDYWLFLNAFINGAVYKHLKCVVVLYDFAGISAIDGFKKYKHEQAIIWNKVVPYYIDEAVKESENLINQNKYYRHLLDYKLVKIALKITYFIQNIRKNIMT